VCAARAAAQKKWPRLKIVCAGGGLRTYCSPKQAAPHPTPRWAFLPQLSSW
jgi:hypothetical protein